MSHSNSGEVDWIESLGFHKANIPIAYVDSEGQQLIGYPDLILENEDTIILVEYKHGGLLNNATCKSSADTRKLESNCRTLTWLNQLSWSNSIYKIMDLQHSAQELFDKKVISVVVNHEYKVIGLKVASSFKWSALELKAFNPNAVWNRAENNGIELLTPPEFYNKHLKNGNYKQKVK